MEHRNVHALAQFLFDIKTFRRFDIFQVDTAEGRLQRRHHINHFIGIVLVDFDIKHINTGEFLKQDALAFHHRFTGQRADIAKPQHRGAVGDNRHEVAARGVFIGGQRVGGDFQTGRGYAWRIRQRQIALGRQRFGRRNLNFAWYREFVKIEGALF